jgi:hypothetical protein
MEKEGKEAKFRKKQLTESKVTKTATTCEAVRQAL